MLKKTKNVITIFAAAILMVLVLAVVNSNAASVASATGYVDSSIGVNVRSGTSTSTNIVTGFSNNTKVSITEEVYTSSSSTSATSVWYHVTAEGKTGYIRSDLIDKVSYTAVTGKTTAALNYRVGPGTSMTKKGTFSNGSSVMVYLKARSSSSNVTWYKVKVGSDYRYACATWIDISGSIFVDTDKDTDSSAGNDASDTTDPYENTSFEEALDAQGFPESYKVKLRELHNDYPEWVFLAKNTGYSFSSAVSKESANGVSLVHSSLPDSYKSTDSDSFTADSGKNIYASSSTSSSVLKEMENGEDVTILGEEFKSNTDMSDSFKWIHVKTSDGTDGYVQAPLTNESYDNSVEGYTDGYVNIRQGAGAGLTFIKTYGDNTKVDIVLTVTSSAGNKWYKIKYGSGYAYICAEFVKVDDTSEDSSDSETQDNSEKIDTTVYTDIVSRGLAVENGNYHETPAASSTSSETYSVGDTIDIVSLITDESGTKWYKVKKDSEYVYIESSKVDTDSEITTESNEIAAKIEAPADASVYNEPDNSSDVIKEISTGSDVSVISKVSNNGSDWYKVIADNGYGYVTADSLDTSVETTTTSDGTVEGVTTAELNYRKGPGTNFEKVGTFKNKNKVKIISSVKSMAGNTWYKINLNGKVVYAYGAYVTPSAAIKTETAAVKGEVISWIGLNYRSAPGITSSWRGIFGHGTEVTILGNEKKGTFVWDKINYKGNTVYAADKFISITLEKAPEASSSTSTEVKTLDVPKETYLYKASGKMTATTDIACRARPDASSKTEAAISEGDIAQIVSAEVCLDGTTWYKVLVNGSYYYISNTVLENNASIPDEVYTDPEAEEETSDETADTEVSLDNLTGTGSILNGTYIPKDGSSWYNASDSAIAYYLDPRNFLDGDRIYMFEDLSYHSEYQTTSVVNKVLAGTELANQGYLASWFVDAGAAYDVSPVFLAARARQETGGGSVAISGYSIDGVTYYNPFNIGAYSSSNPVINGMYYAKSKGWDTKKESIFGAAAFLADGYINNNQNSVYFQRFNVANGYGSVATHQYMTNLTAPYTESISTKNSYTEYGITDEQLTFIIPVYSNMPDSTTL